MKHSKFRVFGNISEAQRKLLLRMVSPAFENIFCLAVTYAYGVTDDYPFPSGDVELVLDGYHRGYGCDALTGYLRSGIGIPLRRRPDGKIFHVTLSAMDGIAPASAGDIDADLIRPIEPITLSVRLERGYPVRYQARKAA